MPHKYQHRKDHQKEMHDNDVNIAIDLRYPEAAIFKLREEKDPAKRQRILIDARRGIYNRKEVG